MAITGAHVLINTAAPEALRELLAGATGWPHVEAGPGWPIFSLPPAELAVHPSDHPGYELSLMCDDLVATMGELAAKGITFRDEPRTEAWGIAVTMTLPGGVEMLLYEPRHPQAHSATDS
jgi:hypothetical protein